DTHQRDLAGRRRRVHPRPSVPVELHRLRGRHLHRRDRLVHRLCHAYLPAAAPGRELQARHLGRWSYLIGWIAVIWVVFITILFMLPTVSPIGFGNFNYTVFAVLVVIGFAGIYWLVSARHWFKGPKVQGSADELAAIERELSV